MGGRDGRSYGIRPCRSFHGARARPCRGFRRIVATAVIPISPIKFYELLTHPENSLIFRGIERCTYRRILADDAAGRQVVEVENESGRFGAGALSRGGGCRQRV